LNKIKMSNYLIHYNHNHDALGRFAKSGSSATLKKFEKYNKKISKSDEKFVSEFANKAALERGKIRNIGKSDADVNEITLNKIVNKNINKSNKSVAKILDKYYNKGFDRSDEYDAIKMGKYYTDLAIAQRNISYANAINKQQGRNDLAKPFYIKDPLDSKDKLPQGYEYKSNKDIKKEQKVNKKSGVQITRDNYGRVTNLDIKNVESVDEIKRHRNLLTNGKINKLSDDQIRKYIKTGKYK